MERKMRVVLVFLFLIVNIAWSNTIFAADYIRGWLICGPFSLNEEGVLSHPYIKGEESITPKAGDVSGGKLWKIYQEISGGYGGRHNPNIINLEDKNAFGILNYAAAYAYVKIESPASCDGYLLTGNDDGIKVWLNHQVVWEQDVLRGCTLDEEKISIHLRKGTNYFLLKVIDATGGWAFCARFVDKDGKDIKGLDYEPAFKEKEIVSLEKPFGVDTDTLALWYFNEGEGKIVSDTTRKYHGKIHGNVGWCEGKFGKALRFNGGKDDYVGMPAFSVTGNTLTLEAWIKLNEHSHGPIIESPWVWGLCVRGKNYIKDADGKVEAKILSPPQLTFYVSTPDYRCLDVPWNVELGRWYHVAGVYDGKEMKLYLDGRLIGSRVCHGEISPSKIRTAIGGRPGITEFNDYHTLCADIDEIRVFNRARKYEKIEDKKGELFAKVSLIEQKTKTVLDLINYTKRKNIEIKEELITVTVAQDYMKFLKEDIEESKYYQAQVSADYLIPSLDEARAKLEEKLKNPWKYPENKLPTYTPLTIRDGVFYNEDNEEVILCGLMRLYHGFSPNFYQGQRHIDKAMGFNLQWLPITWFGADADGIKEYKKADGTKAYGYINYTSTKDYCIEPGEKKKTEYIKEIKEFLGEAVANETYLNYYFPHPFSFAFPRWAFKKFPDIDTGIGGGWPYTWSIHSPHAKKLLEDFYSRIVEGIHFSPPAFSYELAGEPQYFAYDKRSLEYFKRYLKEKHKNIQRLNQLYGTNYTDFDEIPPPTIKPSKTWVRYPPVWNNLNLRYDWYCFNQGRVTDFFWWIKEFIRTIDKKTPVDIKVICGRDNPTEWGTDLETFGEVQDICGFDICLQPPNEMLMQSFSNDVYHSLFPDKPLYDSEWHLVHDGMENYDIPYDYFRAALWLGYLHYQGAGLIWYYDRKPYGQTITATAKYLEVCAKTSLEVRRLAPYIYKFHKVTPSFYLPYFHTDILQSEEPRDNYLLRRVGTYSSSLAKAYLSLYYQDMPVGFVSEKQIKEGKCKEYPLLIIPEIKYVKDGTYQGIINYVKRGGNLFIVGKDSLKYDEYRQERDTSDLIKNLLPSQKIQTCKIGKGRVFFKDTITSREYNDCFLQIARECGISPVFKLVGEDGKHPPKVEMRTAKYGDHYLIYLINLGEEKSKFKLESKYKIKRIKDLIKGEFLKDISTFIVEPLDIQLWEVF